MKIRILMLFLLFTVACEPIEKAKEETKTSAVVDQSGTTTTPTPPTVNASPSTSASTIFFNLSAALRSQHIAQIQSVFSSLSIMIDDTKCSLSTSPTVSPEGEIADAEIDRIFESIKSKIDTCLGSGDDRVKIKGKDLYEFEKNLEKALGDNVVKACSRDSDCARLPYGGYFRNGLGSIYSKKIQGTESYTLQQEIKDIMIRLASDEITDMEDFTWAVDSLPDPVPVPRCVSNVCKGVNP